MSNGSGTLDRVRGPRLGVGPPGVIGLDADALGKRGSVPLIAGVPDERLATRSALISQLAAGD
jgi:hypothetical protein